MPTGHTSAFISRIFVKIGMLWLFHIFCSDAPIICLVRNSVVHSPSSEIRDPRYGNISICFSCSLWMSWRHAMPSLAITLVLSTLMSRLYLRLTQSRWSTNSCSSASKWPTGWCHQHSEGSWSFALQFVVHLEIHRGSPSSPSPLGCWTIRRNDTTLSDPFLDMKPFWQCSGLFPLLWPKWAVSCIVRPASQSSVEDIPCPS